MGTKQTSAYKEEPVTSTSAPTTKIAKFIRIADDDPFLVRKLEEAYKTLEEAPIPDFIIKRMTEKD